MGRGKSKWKRGQKNKRPIWRYRSGDDLWELFVDSYGEEWSLQKNGSPEYMSDDEIPASVSVAQIQTMAEEYIGDSDTIELFHALGHFANSFPDHHPMNMAWFEAESNSSQTAFDEGFEDGGVEQVKVAIETFELLYDTDELYDLVPPYSELIKQWRNRGSGYDE